MGLKIEPAPRLNATLIASMGATCCSVPPAFAPWPCSLSGTLGEQGLWPWVAEDDLAGWGQMAGLGGPAAGGTVPCGALGCWGSWFFCCFFFSRLKVLLSDGGESVWCLIVLEP